MVEFCMFMLVNGRSGYAIVGLLGSPWGTFEFWSRLTKSQCVHCILCSPQKNEKIKVRS